MPLYRTVILLLIVLVLSLITWFSVKDDKNPLYTADMEKSVMEDIEIINYKKATLSWKATIKRALISLDGIDTSLEKITVFYPEKDLILHSNKGYYNFRTGEIKLIDRISGEGSGLSFESRELNYIPSKKLLIALAPNGLVIKGKKYFISGDGGTIRNSHLIEIEGNVRAVFY